MKQVMKLRGAAALSVSSRVLHAMAERVLQRVREEELVCHICLDTYTDPKLLQCFHIYCRGCLPRLVDRKPSEHPGQRGPLVLPCPECRQETPLPAKGVKGLKSAFHINRLLEIVGAVGESQPEQEQENQRNCPEHGEEPKLYCETCGELICWKCAYVGAKHHDHVHDHLDKAFQRYQQEISLSQKQLEKQMEKVTEALQHVDTSCLKITKQYESIKADICQDARKVQLMSQLERLTSAKQTTLVAHRESLKKNQTQLKSCLDFIRSSIASDNHYEVLEMKANVVKQIKDLTFSVQSGEQEGSFSIFDVDHFPEITHLKGTYAHTNTYASGSFCCLLCNGCMHHIIRVAFRAWLAK